MKSKRYTEEENLEKVTKKISVLLSSDVDSGNKQMKILPMAMKVHDAYMDLEMSHDRIK